MAADKNEGRKALSNTLPLGGAPAPTLSRETLKPAPLRSMRPATTLSIDVDTRGLTVAPPAMAQLPANGPLRSTSGSVFPDAGAVESTGGVEVVVVRDNAAKASPLAWRAFELWTKHRIYGIDSTLVCREVLDRRSGKYEEASPLIGLKLGGGRLRQGNQTRYAYPFPTVGMDGMFTDSKRQAHTSRVERFVIRIRDLSTRGETSSLSWEDVEKGQ